jgi:hypothetical protein
MILSNISLDSLRTLMISKTSENSVVRTATVKVIWNMMDRRSQSRQKATERTRTSHKGNVRVLFPRRKHSLFAYR